MRIIFRVSYDAQDYLLAMRSMIRIHISNVQALQTQCVTLIMI